MPNRNNQNFIRTIIIIFIIFTLLGLIRSNIFSIIFLLFILYIFFKFIKSLSLATNPPFGKWQEFIKKSSRANQQNVYDADSMGGKFKHMLEFPKKIAGALITAVVLLLLLTQMIIIIPAGETGVYHLFGKVRDTEISSGLHLVNPFARITRMSIRTEEYTMSSVRSEGKVQGDDSIKALTKEGLNISLDLTVLYHLEEEKASNVYKDIGINFAQIIIRPEIRATIREIVATYNAVDIYAEKRSELTQEIQKRLEKVINPRGIIVESVLLRNVTLPAGLTQSIEEKLQADQDAQRMDFVLDKEKKEAERKRIQAQGQRDAQKIINESLTDKYLNYLYINELKDREGTIYVPLNPSTGLPMFKNIP